MCMCSVYMCMCSVYMCMCSVCMCSVCTCVRVVCTCVCSVYMHSMYMCVDIIMSMYHYFMVFGCHD